MQSQTNSTNVAVLNFLKQRRSKPINRLTGPAPDQRQLKEIIEIATRVPDHGQIEPWRFIVYRGEARDHVGQLLAERALAVRGKMTHAEQEKELTRFNRAPLVIGVISKPDLSRNIPEWEQLLSGAAAAMLLCMAANAYGFATNWITNWYSDDSQARALLGIGPQERVVGFVHIGTCQDEVPDRPRPEVDGLIDDYHGPVNI